MKKLEWPNTFVTEFAEFSKTFRKTSSDENRGILLHKLPVNFQKYLDDIMRKSQDYQKLLNNVSAFEIGFLCRQNKSIDWYRLFARCRNNTSEQLNLGQIEQKKACFTIKENQYIRNKLETLIGKINKIVSKISLTPFLTKKE